MMKTLSEQVKALEALNLSLKIQRDNASAEGIRLRKLLVEYKSRVATLANENDNLANFLDNHGYSQNEIDNIAKGWSVRKEYEDIYDDNYFEGYDDLLYDDYEMKDWQTKEGDFIPIYELEDAHLVAIIKLLRRKGVTLPYEMLKEVHVRKLTI